MADILAGTSAGGWRDFFHLVAEEDSDDDPDIQGMKENVRGALARDKGEFLWLTSANQSLSGRALA